MNTLFQRFHLFPDDHHTSVLRSATPSQRASQGYNASLNLFDIQVMDSLESQNDDTIELGVSQKV